MPGLRPIFISNLLNAMKSPLPFLGSLTFMGVLSMALLTGNCARAQFALERPFTETLAGGEQSSAGLARLSAKQIEELNRQITKELKLARQGDVRGFSTSFSQRRTAAQREAAGLNLLTDAELKTLDDVIARTMAQPSLPGTVARAASVDSIETTRIKPEVHGEVSLAYGMTSGGRSLYGGSMALSVEDPKSGISTAIRYSQFRGDGLFFGGGFGCGGFGWNRDAGGNRSALPPLR